MKSGLVIAGWLLVFAAAVWLRFQDLGARPFHADEATGARITAERMEEQGGRFDPTHFHGPLLGDAAAVACRAAGETTWRSMRKETLRSVTALAGACVVLLPLFWRRRTGAAGALLAAALLACSPLLVYYSRMFIHEMLLVAFGTCFLTSIGPGRRLCLAGLFLGLMYATKESFAISGAAWSAAALPAAWKHRAAWREGLRWWKPAVLGAVVALVVSAAFYTHGFRHPQGAVDAVATYFRYQLVEGHGKPPAYYLDLFAVPHKAGGVWWFGTPVVVLALAAFGASFRKGARDGEGAGWARFLGWSVLAHLLVYSLISYKTPWLACLTWAQLCLLAGFSLRLVPTRAGSCAVAVVAIISLVTQTRQARHAIGRLSSDARNPYAYVPTRRDVEKLESWLRDVRVAVPGIPLEPVAVVGTDYWPLPWYLRDFGRIGYWETPPDSCAAMPLVFAMPDAALETTGLLDGTHVVLPRGLRDGVPMLLFVRKDIWDAWMKTGN